MDGGTALPICSLIFFTKDKSIRKALRCCKLAQCYTSLASQVRAVLPTILSNACRDLLVIPGLIFFVFHFESCCNLVVLRIAIDST